MIKKNNYKKMKERKKVIECIMWFSFKSHVRFMVVQSCVHRLLYSECKKNNSSNYRQQCPWTPKVILNQISSIPWPPFLTIPIYIHTQHSNTTFWIKHHIFSKWIKQFCCFFIASNTILNYFSRTQKSHILCIVNNIVHKKHIPTHFITCPHMESFECYEVWE